MNDIVIIGSIPPPIGGVSIHVKRLLESLKKNEFTYLFVELRANPIIKIFGSASKGKLIHLHTSNVYFRFLFSFFCYLTGKKLLITYHGNLNRYGIFKNFIDRCVIKLTTVPIMVNSNSFKLSRKINPKTQFASAFIPPSEIEALNPEPQKKIALLKKNYQKVFCTNAFKVAYDKNRREIYQITELIQLFNEIKEDGLIISDPSQTYIKLINQLGLHCNENILILSFNHDFNAIIKESDCMIRFTTTDGDSLSVKETLLAGKPVIATNVVDRPQEVILVNDNINDLKDKIRSFKPTPPIIYKENGFDDIVKIYKNNLK